MWMNGRFENEAHLSAHDRGFLLGDGVFETMLAENRAVHWLPAHYQRLHDSLKHLKMRVDYSLADIQAACDGVLKSTSGQPPQQRMVLRLTVSRGFGGRGLNLQTEGAPESWLLTAAPAPIVPAELTCMTVPVLRPAQNLTSRLKTIGYVDNMLARDHARQNGADEGVMLNENGHIACAAAGNIFIQCGEQLFTPPETDGVLAGIIRQIILNRADEIGLSAKTASLTEADVLAADHIFITNSLMGAVAVRRFNDCPKEKSPTMQAISNLIKA